MTPSHSRVRIDRIDLDLVYYPLHMSMGKRVRERQPEMWVATTDFPTAASHPFYTRLNQRLAEHHFDDFVEGQCQPFYAELMGRPGLPPGMYFRLLLIGYFEGIDSERGIAWRAADSFALRDFLGDGLEDAPPDHSTISRTRRLIDLETHRAVFTWVLQCLSTGGLVKVFNALYRASFSFTCRPLDVLHSVYGHCGFLLFQFETECAQHGEDCGEVIEARSRR